MPSAVAAISWPRGCDWMPAFTCSATRAEVKNASATTAVQNDALGICLTQVPQATGSSSGTTKNHRNIWTSRGTLRNSST
ncbi:hypothetical protein D9M68_1002720 [compost metagenome]